MPHPGAAVEADRSAADEDVDEEEVVEAGATAGEEEGVS